MVTDSFNVSSLQDELQKSKNDDVQRIRDIDGIKDTLNKRKAFTMMEARDHDLNLLREQNKDKRDRAIEEGQKKIKPDLQLNYTMKGAPPESFEARKKYVRKSVEATMGKEHEKQEVSLLKSRNGEINKYIKSTRKQERAALEKSQSKKRSEFSRNASDISGHKRTSETKQDYSNRKTLSGDASSRSASTSTEAKQSAKQSFAKSASSRSRGRVRKRGLSR